MNIKKIIHYINQRQLKANNRLIEENVLLGSKREKVAYFLTFKELHTNVETSMKRLKELLKRKGKLIINGNLKLPMITKLMLLSQRHNRHFTIVVNDGYRLSMLKNIENREHLAVIFEEDSAE
ncbi:DUF1694 domain-containing protein [Enterococcus malodoratus]|uniref:Uncharacterized protein n=1 Tax=Enterococcus malodoratus ATCC 43197 TaxID=1158601 RepID=R2RFK5_9ENTE|nr:DUF1694 domain-containing protein [Enterococcus malodoratus]EOH79391.1 hypothetical protein UAI_01369 [Enterococcus malodoratus ATCC 43197]EOT64850.1 hypothetical protein I585_04051 [Enterococcus malodoratus ATCC 43197]OJG62802.1 hypothetical protein RV07_GL001261 [Enterococcus malodoratus]SPX03675.1 Uncharacterized conserved protein [Enterococcus malodoratus]STC72243.1 Uncharacterized conserved protein [Enterococcus malodoratus]